MRAGGATLLLVSGRTTKELMKKEAVRLSLKEILGGNRKHFVPRGRFLKCLEGFDKDIRQQCLHRLGGRSRVMVSVAQAIIGDAFASVQKKGAKTLKGLAPLRFKSTPGFF